MTAIEARVILLRAFVATGELPEDIEHVLSALIELEEPTCDPSDSS